MTIFGPICGLICFVGLVSYYWKELAAEKLAYDRRWYLAWLAKGLVLPILVWLLLNVGHSPVMPALVQVMPRRNIAPPPTIVYPVDALPNTPPTVIPSPPKWVGVGPVKYVAIQTAAALAGISLFWAAITLGWFVTAFVRQLEDRRNFIVGGVTWCGIMLPFVGLLVAFHGLGGFGLGLLLWFGPIAHYATRWEPVAEPKPAYTQAVIKLKFGKYAEAEAAIIRELEKCENDFEGWLMLAELYARQFDDMIEAERTVRSLCDDPGTTISQVSVALHKLADWQLQFHSDPLAARRALEEIIKRMPGTHLATMARHRIRQLPASREEWLEQKHGKRVNLSALSKNLDAEADKNVPEISQAEALSSAKQYVEKLERDPKDVAAREMLARIFAEQLKQPSLALEQLELLLEMPEQPPEKMAEWLALVAAWQIKYQGDKEAGRKTLQRLIRDFPQTIQAFAAQRRLKLMEFN